MPETRRWLLAGLLLLLLPQLHLLAAPPRLNFDDLVWIRAARQHPGARGFVHALGETPFAWRPLVDLWVRASTALAGTDALRLHALGLLLVGLCGLGLAAAARPLVGPRAAALGVALWELHPATGAMGTFYSDAGGPLYLGLSALALIAHSRADGRGAAAGSWWLGLLAYAGALLAKEWAVAALPVLLLADARRPGPPLGWRVRIAGILPHAALAAGAAVLAVGAASARGAGGLLGYELGAGALGRLAATLIYAALPSGALQGLLRGALPLLGLAALGLLGVLLLRGSDGTRLLALCCLATTLPLLPHSLASYPQLARYAAPAAAPVLLAVACVLLAGGRRARTAAALGVALVLLASARDLVLRPLRGKPFGDPAGRLGFVIWCELLGLPENARGLELSPAEARALRFAPPPVPETALLVLDALQRGHAAEIAGDAAAAREHHARARELAAREGGFRFEIAWLGAVEVSAAEVERVARSR